MLTYLLIQYGAWVVFVSESLKTFAVTQRDDITGGNIR